MDTVITNFSYIEHLSLIGMFFIVGWSGYLIPVPEEVVLILFGYVCALRGADPLVFIAICFIAVLVGDSSMYFLSLRGSRLARFLKRKVSKKRFAWFEGLESAHAGFFIFFSRFIVGMRFLNPIISGFLRVPYKTFILFNGLSALIYVPFLVFIGYFFQSKISATLGLVMYVRHALFTGFLLLLTLAISLFIHKKFLTEE